MTHEKLKPNEYRCDACGVINEKGWSDEDAEKESKELWGTLALEDRAVICDDCFNNRTPKERKIMGDAYKSPWGKMKAMLSRFLC